MTRPLGLERTPRMHLIQPGQWPDGEVQEGDGMVPARYAQGLALRLGQAIGSRSFRQIARISGVSHGTVSHVFAGLSWPDLITVARLEWALGQPIWPGADLLAEDFRQLRAEKESLSRRLRRQSAAFERA
jgi:hypothetical protein